MNRSSLSSWSIGLLLAAVAAVAGAESGPTVDEVLERYVEARGGREAWQAIETLTFKGDYTSFSKTAPFVWYHARDQKTRFESLMNGHEFVMAYDDETFWGSGWPFDPESPSPMRGQDVVTFRQEVDQPSSLFYARDRGYQVTLRGETEVDGIPAIELELVRPDGEAENWFLDPDTYLEIARHSNGSDFGRPEAQRYFYDDFRPVGEVMIPHFIEGQWYTRYRTLEIHEVAVNQSLVADLFDLPPPPGMESFADLGGEWEVTFEHRNRPEVPFETATVRSTIEPMLRGVQMQERLTEPSGLSVVYSISYDRFQELYRHTTINDYSSHLDVSQGTFEEGGRLVLDNLATGTARSVGEQTTNFRHTFVAEVEGGEFAWEVEASRDGGENWLLLERRTYRRAPATNE